jgi:SAM-dependent methyltransferase
MRYLDRLLQSWRIQKARRFLNDSVRVIDVGAHRGELFRTLGNGLQEGFGIEPLIKAAIETGTYTIWPGVFPRIRPDEGDWDAVTMLAVLEHIPRAEHAGLVGACHELLKVGGRVIITVPGRIVDYILSVLELVRLIDGMSLEEHTRFEPDECARLFSKPRFKLLRHERFELGLNHLYVFEKQLTE